MRTLLIAALLCALGAGPFLLGAGDAAATGLTAPVVDCNAHAKLTRHYTVATLRAALATMPAEVREYTNCVDVIQRQLLAQLGRLAPRGDGAARGSGTLVPAWLIALLAVLAACAGAFGALAVRERRRRGSGAPLN